MHLIARNRGKEHVIPDDVGTPADDELSSSSSLPLSLSSIKNARESIKAKSCKKPSHHLGFNDAISGASRKVRREVSMRQNQPDQAPGNMSILLPGTSCSFPSEGYSDFDGLQCALCSTFSTGWILMRMNHAYISIKFSVFFIPKMHDSQPFSLILR